MRKTSYIMESSSPFWNQTFVYPGESLLQLKTKKLEITAWSHNRNLANEFLGEFMLDLSGECVIIKCPGSCFFYRFSFHKLA